MALTVFTDRKVQIPAPVLIGMPGFVESLHKGRIEDILQSSKEQAIGYGVVFSPIEKKGDTVYCHFDLETYLNDVHEAVEQAKKDPRIDNSKKILIASSIGGAIAAYYLARHNPNIKGFITIAPVTGWNAYMREHAKARVDEIGYFDITSKHDEEKNIKRRIPANSFDGLRDLNALEILADYKPNGMSVLTLLGKEDEIVDVNSIRDFHRKLGGIPENLVEYDFGHVIPNELSRDTILDFIKQSLQT